MSKHGSESDFIVELSWNETLTEMFGIKNFPHFIIVGKENKLVKSMDHLSIGHQFLLDSLIAPIKNPTEMIGLKLNKVTQ